MKTITKDFIKNQLATNPTWAVKALVKIYERQTIDEQSSQSTKENNGIGFNGLDANILSSFAEQVNKGRNLSVKQMTIVYKKMPRYWKQVASLFLVINSLKLKPSWLVNIIL